MPLSHREPRRSSMACPCSHAGPFESAVSADILGRGLLLAAALRTDMRMCAASSWLMEAMTGEQRHHYYTFLSLSHLEQPHPPCSLPGAVITPTTMTVLAWGSQRLFLPGDLHPRWLSERRGMPSAPTTIGAAAATNSRYGPTSSNRSRGSDGCCLCVRALQKGSQLSIR